MVSFGENRWRNSELSTLVYLKKKNHKDFMLNDIAFQGGKMGFESEEILVKNFHYWLSVLSGT